MKVFIGSQPAEGGIRRVYEAQQKYFPALGIEITDQLSQADLAACHGTEYAKHPITVAHNHGLYWYGYEYPWAAWAVKANQKLVEIMKGAKAVTTPSEWVANSIRRGTLIDPIVCQHGIDIDEWKPILRHEPYIIWCKTRPDPICNPNDMNRLAALAPDIRFISTFGKEAGNVSLVGALPYDEMKPYIQNAALYLATVRETGGITVLEAMASGTVPLGWNWGVNPELIDHKVNGYLATPGDYDDLYEGLKYCQANWKELSANAVQAVTERFQWEHVIGKYREVYEKALQPSVVGPTVSVIITAYNLEQYLPACIESVVSQDYTDWELIIVDDASPDACGRIADEWADKDPRIKVLHNRQNAYLAEARNIAIRASTGRYIMPLDADDKLGPSALRLLVGGLEADPGVDIATGSMAVVEEDGITPWAELARTGGISDWPPPYPNYNAQIELHNQVPYASMYRRWVWERTGGYRRRYKTAEDADFWTRAMSYGAAPAKVTGKPTLIYTNRSSSMSHKEPAINWTSWFTWAKYPDMTPYAASGDPPDHQLFWPVNAYGPIEVSVVIPCGPGHDWYLQDALDSLTAQTFLYFECIVVNDSGQKWFDGDTLINPHLAGFPWVKIIESTGPPKGVAWARNTGTAAAKSPLVFYLDADDYLQPAALDILVKTQKLYGGWVYSDWFDQNMQPKVAKDWSADGLTVKMLGPMAGLYPRDAVLAVGFEDFGGWEDWDVQLSLLERGICGTHVAHPLFVYRYDTGTRREDNFEKAENLLQYIKEKHKNLYSEEFMAGPSGCGKCGGGGGKSKIVAGSSRTGSGRPPQIDESMVLVEYIGPMTQTQRFRSKLKPAMNYRFGGDPGADSRKFYVYKVDAAWILGDGNFRHVPEQVQADAPVLEEVPVLEAYTRPAPIPYDEFVKKMEQEATHMEFHFSDDPMTAGVDWGTGPDQTAVTLVDRGFTPVARLALAPEVISILENAGLDTAEKIAPLSVAQLVQIKGIGATRATKIIAAVKEAL